MKIKNIRWYVKWSEVAQLCLTLCDPMDCSLPGFSVHGIFVHGIFQARVLEWVAISFSRGSSWLRDGTQVSCISGRCFTLWVTREALRWYRREVCTLFRVQEGEERKRNVWDAFFWRGNGLNFPKPKANIRAMIQETIQTMGRVKNPPLDLLQ